MIFESRGPRIPSGALRDSLTIPQFILDSQHPLRARRGPDSPWFIDNATGRQYDLEEVRSRTFGLANSMAHSYRIREDDVVIIFSPNDIDYPTAIWATHRLGAIASCSNPSYTAAELAFQIREINAKFIITHPVCLAAAQEAAKSVNFPLDRIVIITPPAAGPASTINNFNTSSIVSINDMIEIGLREFNVSGAKFTERTLNPGEGKTKLAFLSFSSGTTGKPKAVAISHYAVISNVIMSAAFLRINDPTFPFEERRYRDGDVSLAVLPMFHIYGLVMVLHSNIFFGLPLVVMPKYTFGDFLTSIVKYRVTHLWIVPPQMVAMVKHPDTKKYDLSHVRVVMGGAAPVSPTLDAALRKVLVNANIGQGYGMTGKSKLIKPVSVYLNGIKGANHLWILIPPALAATIAIWPLEQSTGGTPGSAGQLISGLEAKVIKSDGTLAGYNEPGELAVRGPSMALRYENNPEATKETFRDGWVHTGDEVVFKENGDIFIVDRLKEIIKVRGFQVAPAELEGHLLSHPDVSDSGVIGVPNEYSGEQPCAFIVLEAKAAARAAQDPRAKEQLKESIAKHVSSEKVRYKWLDGGVIFVDAIPKNPSGKILRRVLRDIAKSMKLGDVAVVTAKL